MRDKCNMRMWLDPSSRIASYRKGRTMSKRNEGTRDGCARERSFSAVAAGLVAFAFFGTGIGAWITGMVAAGAEGSKPTPECSGPGA